MGVKPPAAMPLYSYQVITPDGAGPVVELLQRLGEPALTRHPETGAPLRKLITAPNLPLKHGDRAVKSKLTDQNLSRHGFTKYVREGRGRYVKTAGAAALPPELHR